MDDEERGEGVSWYCWGGGVGTTVGGKSSDDCRDFGMSIYFCCSSHRFTLEGGCVCLWRELTFPPERTRPRQIGAFPLERYLCSMW